MKVLGAVQPAYLAWLPFFRRMIMSDVFIYLDDVEYSKNSFHNRNKIATKNGPLLLTVPVNYSGNSKESIARIPLARNIDWAQKHLRSIEMSYSRAPFFLEVHEGIAPIYGKKWASLGDLNVALLEFFRVYLGISTPCHRSSELPVSHLNANEKLVALCRHFGADHFVVKPNTEEYHPADAFRPHGIEFTYFRNKEVPYPQQQKDFLPGLSVLDLMMNCGREGAAFLR